MMILVELDTFPLLYPFAMQFLFFT